MKQSFSSLEQIINSIRQFFSARGFREVIVPIFNTSLPLEPNIYAFHVGKYYLSTSPEATLKKAIAKGAGNCFAIGHTFRDLEGSSPIHKPEFLMLEWYREDTNYIDLMGECQELILYLSRSITQTLIHNYHTTVYGSYAERTINNRKTKRYNTSIDLAPPWKRVSMEGLFKKYARLTLNEIIDDGTILKVAAKRGYNTKNASWEQIFNQIFLNEIEKHLPKEPFFLIDYPAKISPLCAKRGDKPYLAQRFEFYINGIEIANGNTENTNATEVLKAMKEEEINRQRKGLICPPIDMEFIDALKKMQGGKYAGIGLGIDRLIMILGEIDDIKMLNPDV